MFDIRRLAVGVAAGLALLAGASGAHAEKPLTIGVTAGPVAILLEHVATRARDKGIEVELVEFSDWVTPNSAVADGSIDANFFQHVTFLDQQNEARGYDLVPVDPGGVLGPVGLFSNRYTDVAEVQDGDTVSEPPRVCRRPFGLSYAAISGCSSIA